LKSELRCEVHYHLGNASGRVELSLVPLSHEAANLLNWKEYPTSSASH
jgi:hypothetical protein